MEHSELYQFATRFWWLIFPVLGMGMGLIGTILHHRRTVRALELIQAYVAHGKEPPPDILRLAQGRREKKSGSTLFIPACLFAAISSGLVVLGVFEQEAGLFFAAIVVGGLAVGFFVTAMLRLKRREALEEE